MHATLDETDFEIRRLLIDDACRPYREISCTVNLSSPLVHAGHQTLKTLWRCFRFYETLSVRSDSVSGPLSRWIACASEYGPYAFLTGGALMGIAFLIKPTPDPTFLWATLPESFRLSHTQPRIGHWPVTYTIGLWLIFFTLPLMILQAYQRCGSVSRLSAGSWLTAAPVAIMVVLTTYCRFFWPNLHPVIT